MVRVATKQEREKGFGHMTSDGPGLQFFITERTVETGQISAVDTRRSAVVEKGHFHACHTLGLFPTHKQCVVLRQNKCFLC